MGDIRRFDLSEQADPGQNLLALRDGMFLLRHELPEALLDDVYTKFMQFFTLASDVKLRYVTRGSNGQAGYVASSVEIPERGNTPDWKELFHWGLPLPVGHPLRTRYPDRYPEQVSVDDEIPGFTDATRRLHGEMLKLQKAVLRKTALALGVQPSYFVELLEDAPVVNRAVWYPPMSESPGPGRSWALEHADFDLITVLPRATGPGLEVCLDGDWVPVQPGRGEAVVNAGMMLERLTSGVVPAALHRVRSDSDTDGGRLSVVQFCHPAPWFVLNPLTMTNIDTGHRCDMPGMTADDVFRRTMYRINRLSSN